MRLDSAVVVQQIDDVLREASTAGGSRIPTDGHPQVTDHQGQAEAVTLVSSCIARLAPPGSHYVDQAARVEEAFKGPSYPPYFRYHRLVGILKVLRADYAAGRMLAVHELIHAELFADLLDAAQHLLDESYKDPAAVLAGGALEAHLRKLADKNAVALLEPDGKPRKTSAIAVDLARTPPGALSKLDSKNVTAWLGLRNDAAHGDHGKYVAQQVALMIAGVRDFITRTPA